MRHLKICMLGAPAVGKTSLVAQFVEGLFSPDYVTTVGVKVDRKDLSMNEGDARLILWDINGEDRFHRVQPSYLRGASGALVVIDGTRPKTVSTAAELKQRLIEVVGDVPIAVILNKVDLTADWAVDATAVATELSHSGSIITTSAKTGAGVEDGFQQLAREILQA